MSTAASTNGKATSTDAIAFLAKHWPGEGRRHKCYGALCGGLLRSGLPVDRVQRLVEELAEATHDEQFNDRVNMVEATATRLRGKEATTGWPTLAELLGNDGAATLTEFKRRAGLTITLADLARHKRLPESFLQAESLHDLPLGGVGIPYKGAGGKTLAVKERTALKAGDGSYWPKGHRLLAYGEHRLDDTQRAGYQVVVEGESDCWALWFHCEPALGLPGADTVNKTLHQGHVAGRHLIYVVEEPDGGGRDFVKNVAARLAALGWKGELKVVRLPVKDASELHVSDPDNFKSVWRKALDEAQLVPLPPPGAGGPDGGEPWPEPVPLTEVPEAAPFPLDVLPERLAKFVEDGAKAIPCPPDYVAVPLLVLSGGAIGASRALKIKGKHIQRANLYAANVAEPGSGKSPAQDLTTDTIHEVEERLQAAWEDAMERYEEDMVQYAADLKEYKKKGSDPPEKPKKPILSRMTADDTTVEGLVPILQENPRGVVIASDELTGWVLRMNAYREGGKGSDRQFFCSAWSGATYTKDRKGDRDKGPIRLRRPFLGVVGGIPPRKLRALRGDRPGQRAEDNDDGFLDRILFSFAREFKATGEDWCEPTLETLEAAAKVLENLRSLEMVVQQDGLRVSYRPYLLRLSANGRQEWKRFTERHAEELNAEDFPGHLRGPWAKMRGYCGRLALLIHYLRWACGEFENDKTDVDGESVRRAVRLIAYFKSHARKVYSAMEADPRVRAARPVLAWVLRERRTEFKRWEAFSDLKSDTRFPTPDSLDKPLELLVSHGMIRPRDTARRPGPGRPPATVYDVNPALLRRPENPVNPVKPPGDPPDNGENPEYATRPAPDPDSGEGAGDHLQDLQDSQDACVGEAEAPIAPPPDGGAVGVSYRLVTDADGLEAVQAALADAEAVALDLETTGLDPRKDRVRLLTVAVPTIDSGHFAYLVDCFQVDPRPLFPALADVPPVGAPDADARGPGRKLVGHNLAFDLSFLAALGFEPGEVADTMLLSQLLHGTRKPKGFHKLEQVVARELRREVNKDEQTSAWSAPVLTPEQLRYAADDALVLLPLHAALMKRIRTDLYRSMEKAAHLENRALPAVAWLARSGAPFDRDAWESLARQAVQEAEDLAKRLDEEAPARDGYLQRSGAWNWSSPEQVKEAFAAVSVTLDSTDDDALAAVNHPLAELLRQYRAASKRASTYGLEWLAHVAPDGRVYAGWRQIGADSGRMSCSAPNLQNLPRGAAYRKCFRAPASRVLVKADYSQIELRIAAKITGDEAMLEAYRSGADLHTLTAQRVLGLEWVNKEQRQLAKALNFGLLFGMSAKTFRDYAKSNYDVDLTLKDATAYRDAFFKAYPGLAQWHRQVKHDRAPMTWTLGGRRRLLDAKVSDTLRLNSPVQGTGADGLKLALALLWERRGQCPGAFPVLAVHDEVVIECGAEHADAAAAWLKAAMLDSMAPLIAPIPVAVDLTIGQNWDGDPPTPAPHRLAPLLSSASVEYYTPPHLLDAARRCLGGIDLDPCSNSHDTPNVPAGKHFTREDDGLAQAWGGRVFMNPPYGREIGKWVEKLVTEHSRGAVTEALALVPARTGTGWSDALAPFVCCFLRGRVQFVNAKGPAPFPSAVVYLGPRVESFVEAFGGMGRVVTPHRPSDSPKEAPQP
jgi:DNA polymerase-1